MNGWKKKRNSSSIFKKKLLLVFIDYVLFFLTFDTEMVFYLRTCTKIEMEIRFKLTLKCLWNLSVLFTMFGVTVYKLLRRIKKNDCYSFEFVFKYWTNELVNIKLVLAYIFRHFLSISCSLIFVLRIVLFFCCIYLL